MPTQPPVIRCRLQLLYGEKSNGKKIICRSSIVGFFPFQLSGIATSDPCRMFSWSNLLFIILNILQIILIKKNNPVFFTACLPAGNTFFTCLVSCQAG
jgi:hypothetical protein